MQSEAPNQVLPQCGIALQNVLLFFFFSWAVCDQIQWTPFLKFPNKYRIYTCCLHCRPSTFPHADVTVQGEGYLNSSISCIYVHAHTHTHSKRVIIRMAGMYCALSLEIPNGSCRSRTCRDVFSASGDKVNAISIPKMSRLHFSYRTLVVLLANLNAQVQEIQRKRHRALRLGTLCWLPVTCAGLFRGEGAIFRGTDKDRGPLLCNFYHGLKGSI